MALLGKARKDFDQKIFKEGIELWKKQQELTKHKKQKEQQEKYPFGHGKDMRPRGLKNLRLEELFPYKDHLNAKRFVGSLPNNLNLGVGRPGGGAPILSESGNKLTTTKEDPLLRFQFGSNDLRRTVDNTFRYKTDKKLQEKYKKELDVLVEEKRRNHDRAQKEDNTLTHEQFLKTPPWGKRGPGGFAWRHPKSIGFNFLKSLGWSTEKTLKELSKNEMRKGLSISRRLSPLLDSKENGIELVPLLAKQRRFPLKIHLDTTDVTNQTKFEPTMWDKEGSSYLKDLNKQMDCRQKQIKQLKVLEREIVNSHFSTWDGFWGRPGHGAPKSLIKKQRLDRLLYPQIVTV